ncbi:hypothetical protein JCM8097_007209, partial [Rhodosporidiobolus ruineniae]
MPCGVLGKGLNLVVLAALVGCAVFYFWPTYENVKLLWTDGDTSSRSHVVAIALSGAAFLLFVLGMCCSGICWAIPTLIVVIAEIAAYITWGVSGLASAVCDGAQQAASSLDTFSTNTTYVQCDLKWVRIVIYV